MVLDVGTHSTKAGYAGEDTPKFVFPTVRPARLWHRRAAGARAVVCMHRAPWQARLLGCPLCSAAGSRIVTSLPAHVGRCSRWAAPPAARLMAWRWTGSHSPTGSSMWAPMH